MSSLSQTPIQCVGIVCFRGDEILLIKRGKPPREGEWSIPGGRIDDGEEEAEAALRELSEETSVQAKLIGKIETVEARFDGVSYDLHDYAAIWQSGQVQAGDDANEARFVDSADLPDGDHYYSCVGADYGNGSVQRCQIAKSA